ncbi:11849_t:CDS:2 [Cetraspora pellucida]|uniref:11849_t:CDS:1 n=1 Tax=Cetraspora pellucida TaxID=1433469 RepID=A0ACA9MEC7_9GLOM|nr:11849_t:CDS:2 [Cetraspora pellucida]
MNLFVLEQLIDSSESLLLIWQQLKHIRGEKRKERTPSWFIKLEEKTLKKKDTREYQVVDSLRKEEKDLILGVPITAYTELRKIIENCNFEQELNVEIIANNLESAIIQNLVKDRKLSEDLTSAHEKLRGKAIIEYYTDEALEDNNKNINAERMSELEAIWSAILTASCKTTTHIFTDSKAAIEALEKNNTRIKTRSWFKIKNRSIIRQIKSCCKAKDLNLVLHKIKDHSRNKWNDLADKLAKKELKNSLCLNVPEVASSSLQAVPKWKKQVIESLLRLFINIITATAYETEWANLSRTAKIIALNQDTSSDTELN